MTLKLTIKCPSCDNWFIEDWDKVLKYCGIRPGLEWGIDTIRFYALPTIFCNKCHSTCNVILFDESIKTQITKKTIAHLQIGKE